MAYATKEDYTAYLNGRAAAVPLNDFPYWADLASVQVDAFTFGRLKDSETLAEYQHEAVRAVCGAAEAFYRDDSESIVTSQSVKGFSQSFAQPTEKMSDRAARIIKQELALTGLLYGGF